MIARPPPDMTSVREGCFDSCPSSLFWYSIAVSSGISIEPNEYVAEGSTYQIEEKIFLKSTSLFSVRCAL